MSLYASGTPTTTRCRTPTRSSSRTGDEKYAARAEETLNAFAADIEASVIGHSGLVANAIDLLGTVQVAIAAAPGDRASGRALERAVLALSLPGALLTRITPDRPATAPALTGKGPVDGAAAAYLCLGPPCSPPVSDPHRLRAALVDARQA
jgi:uncharacterized protein YyaL (SSP411 family)